MRKEIILKKRPTNLSELKECVDRMYDYSVSEGFDMEMIFVCMNPISLELESTDDNSVRLLRVVQ